MRKIPLPWSNPSEAVLYIVIMLVAIGTVNVFSASFVLAGQMLQDSFFFLKKDLTALVIGFVGLTLAARMDHRRLVYWLLPLVLLTGGMLIAVSLMGVDANGAKRWLKLGIMQFQPSEIAKLVAVILTAAYLGPRVEKGKPVSLISWPVFIIAAMCILILKQPDMGTAVIIAAACVTLFLPSGIPLREKYMLLFCTVGGIIYLIFAAAYRAERISAWLDPWAFQQTSGYQAVQSLLAIGSGSLLGAGLGKGASKFQYLPEAHTDFAYAILCQEMGFIGAVVVLILFGMLAWYGIKIALNAPDGFGMMLAAGATFMIVGQAVGNIAMVSGLLPVTGIPLPFISFGGTSLIVNLVTIGLIIAVGRRSNLKEPSSESSEVKKGARRFKLVEH